MTKQPDPDRPLTLMERMEAMAAGRVPTRNGDVRPLGHDRTRYQVSNINAHRGTATLRRADPKPSKAERKAAKKARRSNDRGAILAKLEAGVRPDDR